MEFWGWIVCCMFYCHWLVSIKLSMYVEHYECFCAGDSSWICVHDVAIWLAAVHHVAVQKFLLLSSSSIWICYACHHSVQLQSALWWLATLVLKVADCIWMAPPAASTCCYIAVAGISLWTLEGCKAWLALDTRHDLKLNLVPQNFSFSFWAHHCQLASGLLQGSNFPCILVRQ